MIKFLVLGLTLVSTVAAMASELDSEVNAFQVQLVNKQKYAAQKKRKDAREQIVIAQSAPQKDLDVAENPTSYYVAPKYLKKDSKAFLQKLTALPSLSTSAFDGADNSVVSAQGLTKSLSFGFSGTISGDLNIFGDRNFFVETGLSYLTLGSQGGINYVGGLQVDQLQLNYIGINLLGKYIFSGENTSSFYVKAGATPLFLSGQSYSNLGSLFLNQYRYGVISSFDVALNVGIGYSYKLNQDISLVVDITGYQGLMPVSNLYSIYNTGFTTGIGASYSL